MDLHSADARPENAGGAAEPRESLGGAQNAPQQEPAEVSATPNEQMNEAISNDNPDVDAMNEAQLRAELRAAIERCEASDTKYTTLLEKVTQMRSTLGDRLRQDAEELDRREQQIDELNGQVEGLRGTVSALEKELSGAVGETERVTGELDKMRASISKAPAVDPAETARLEAQCRLLGETVEAQRVDLDRWERSCLEECTAKEEYAAEIRRLENVARAAEEREQQSRLAAADDRRVAQQLHEALEELQMYRDVQRTIGEMQQQVENADAQVETHRVRLAEVEEKCAAMSAFEPRVGALEREVKEKNLLIDKLRHEAVILNEHLTEALRQIRRDSADYLVDRRLVTNLFVQFLLVPHADPKRFEILRLIASVLHWNDEEREKAGLQRAQGGLTGMLGSLVGRKRANPAGNAGDEVC